jgi:hypothetical protein
MAHNRGAEKEGMKWRNIIYYIINNNFDDKLFKKLIDLTKDYYELISIKNYQSEEFMKKYRKFWTMGPARLHKDYYDKYFETLLKLKEKSEFDEIDELKNVLSLDKERYQFSFATKLLHTVNKDLPIYDKYIGKFYLLDEQPKERKIEVYSFLINEYKRIIERKIFDPIINKARKFLSAENIIISDIKYIDSIIFLFSKELENCISYRESVLYN